MAEDFVIVEDHTGTDLGRPGLRRLIEGASAGRFDVVIVYTLDRLYRPKEAGQEWQVFAFLDELRQRGVRVEFVDTTIASEGPLSGVIQFLRTWQAGQERAAFLERTTRGKRARAKAGRLPHGTGRGIFGYSYDKATKRRDIHPDQAAVVRRIFDMASAGSSTLSIASTLNGEGVSTLTGAAWHPRTLHHMLRNPSYKGVTVYQRTRRVGGKVVTRDEADWIHVDGATPPIVSTDLWQAVQVALDNRRKQHHSATYLLSGYAFCGYCSHPLSGHTMNRRYPYYRCRHQLRSEDNPTPCGFRYVQRDRLESKVWGAVAKVLADPDMVLRELRDRQGTALPMLDAEIADTRSRLASLRDREHRLIRLFELGQLDEAMISARLKAVKAERGKVEADLASLEHQLADVRDVIETAPALRDVVSQVAGRLESADFEHKLLALDALRVKVKVWRDRIELAGAVPFARMGSGGQLPSDIGHHWTNIGITTWV
jgi:site-specific DNA recombinase